MQPAPTASVEAINADAAKLQRRATDSLRLAIEFVQPAPKITGAVVEAVLMLFHHGFEMLLKSIVLEKTHSVHDGERGYSYTFDTCLRLAQEDLKVIDPKMTGVSSPFSTRCATFSCALLPDRKLWRICSTYSRSGFGFLCLINCSKRVPDNRCTISCPIA